MPKLTQSQLDLLHDVLMQYCEDCDTSTQTGQKIDRIWQKILIQNQKVQPCIS